MPLNATVVATLFRTELRMLVRDRRTVVFSILLPLVIMPIMLFATSGMQRARHKKLENTIYQYAVTGRQADAVRAFIAAIPDVPPAEPPLSEPTGEKPAPFKYEEVTVDDPAVALNEGKLHFYVVGQTAAEARAETAAGIAEPHPPAGNDSASQSVAGKHGPAKEKPKKDEDSPERLIDGAPVACIVFRADRDDSQAGMRRMRGALQAVRAARRDAELQAAGFPVSTKDVAVIDDHNIAPEGQVAGLAFGRMVTLLATMLIMSGCAVVATDSLAGEKERGTLETLLTTAATRLEIIVAKHLAVLAVAVVIALIQAANLFAYVTFKFIPVPANFAAALPPGVVLLLLLLFLPLTALAASTLLLTSGYAKTYKESQLYFMPVFLLAGLLAAAAFLPAISLRSAIVVVPVANIAVAAREILTGTFDWPMLAVAWLATAAAAAGITRLSVRFLATEKLITATESDAVDFAGGPPLFRRLVSRWFLVMWALLLVVSNYGSEWDPRLQILVNLVGIFFGADLLMVRRYRLDLRTTFALRRPKPAVWLAIGGAVPSAIFAGMGVIRLSEFLFPISPDFAREMAQAFQFENIPTWQLVLLVGVLPGFFEEITFRGLLLHGLHRRLHPAVLVVVVGVVFGLFHVTLPRLIPTAYLGVLLATTVLLTGSIYPAMVWHAANNIIMILYGEQALPVIATRPGYAAAGGAALLLCFLVIWWNRTPYPGLRPWRRTLP